jgi:hypothetical protein
MDNITKIENINENEHLKMNKIQKKFINDMINKDINVTKFITKNQINKIVKFKTDINDDMILDENIKYNESMRIRKETEQLNNLASFLKNELHSKIIFMLLQENGINDTDRDNFIKNTPESLNITLTNNKHILKDSVLDSYTKNLIRADSIDFSLFYFGTPFNIFSLVKHSFINESKVILKKGDFNTISKITNMNTSNILGCDYLLVDKEKYDEINEKDKDDIRKNKMNLTYYDEDEIDDIFRKDSKLNNKLNNCYQGILNKLYPDSKIGNNRFYVNICHHYKFMELVDILINMNNDPNKIKEFKKNIVKEIKDNFVKKYIDVFEYNYLHYLAFDYVKDTKPKISIHTKNIKENTLNKIREYLEIIKDILVDIINNNKNQDITKIESYIEDEYKKRVKGKITSGFLVSTLYNFHKKDKYNIQAKYINNPAYRNNITKTINIDEYIEQCKIYFYKDKDDSRSLITKINNHELMSKIEEGKNIRMILTRKQLQNLNNIYKFFFKGFIQTIQKIIHNYEISQQKYLYILDLLIINDKQKFDFIKEKEIANEFKIYLKNHKLLTNVNIILSSKVHFSKIIFELNNKLLRVIKDTNNLSDKYNRFITEYSLWIIYIIKYISSYPNDSKQIYHFEKILQMFMNEKDIKNWYNSCIRNNLSYFLPVFYKGNSNYSFFLDIITNKKSYKIKPNDLIIVKYKKSNIKASDDEITTWNNNTFNIIIDDSYERILTFIKKYIKCQSSIDMDDFNVIKSLITRCNTKKKDYDKIISNKIELAHKFNNLTSISDEIKKLNKELALSEEIEHDCRHLISYHQIIKEIIKTKYPFRIDNSNNLSNLNIKVKEYQQELYEQIPK